ncbi:hypothetical protein Tco_1347063 [Tanacetum coccineum]
MLMKPENSGRVARWAIELREHEIEYKLRNTIKAQILANFLAATQEGEEEEEFQDIKEKQEKTRSSRWKLYIDGGSSYDGFRAGLMLVNPEGVEVTNALKFEFKASNNETEYEAVIEDASKQGRINAIDADDDITLVSVQDDADKEMFDVDALNGEEVFVADKEVNNEVSVVEEVAQVNVCGSFDHLQVDCNYLQKQFQNQRMVKPVWNNAQRVNHQNFAKKTHPCAKKNMVLRVVLMKSGLVSINVAHSKTTVNAARPMSHLSKTAHLTVKRPIHKNTIFINSNINQRVNTIKGNNVNAVKASACWIHVSDGLGPQKKLIFLPNVPGNPQMDLQDQGVIDSGCSRHITGNMSYLIDYEEIDGGYIAFGGNPKEGKIIGKGTIKTGNLDFENVYFVRELKFILFSVLQMCDKKNSVLFNDTECIVLSSNFNLIDESQVLLRVLRKNNMYSVDLKNIVPKGGLTCLFAKATSDESKLWHRRLVRMTKVIKGEFEKIKDVKVEDVLLTCDTPLEVFNNEVSRLSGMDDDLFTYEVEVANIPCDSKMDDDSEHEADDDMGYDPSDVAFTEWLGSKIFNYKTMDHYTMKALWIYWIRGDDEVELTDEESSDDMDEVAEVFRIDTNLFNFETPMCKAFNEFNYLLQIDPDLLTKDIEGFKTYEDYKNDWIYEWNKDVPWVDEKPWTNTRVWTKPTPVKHTCKPFNYKSGCLEWPTCSWKNDGYCNGGNLPGTYIIENQLHYQDYEWYKPLEDSELKDEALRNKAIMEGFIKEDDDESRYEQKRRWNTYTNYDDAYEINHEHNKSKELCEFHELLVRNTRRYMMIKYSFNDDEEYVAVKDDEYDDLTVTRKEACRAYQEIFQIMDEGWMVTRAK